MHFKVKRLACIKGNQYLFRNLSFALAAGELLLIQGQNGAGKSSLLKILAGLSSSDAGEIEINSELSYVGHKEGIKKGLTVIENIQLQLVLAHAHPQHDEIEHYLRQFKLLEYQHKLCSELSMGQRRKVALIAHILKQKPIWILDEPFTGLDKESIAILCSQFTKHLSQQGMIIVASHAMEGIRAHHTIEISSC